YRLAREQRRISVGDIVRVVGAGDGEEEAPGEGSPLGQDVVQPMWQEAHDEFLARLDGISIQDLCSRAHGSAIQRPGAAQPDYAI
ncbi:MAG: Rrf2 family transcriptional regulator, partial [Alphaproteobacteria bacterium]